jgi:ribonuclease HI
MRTDVSLSTQNDKRLKIIIPEREEWSNQPPIPANGFTWFTDGSKQDEKAGAGAYCPRSGTRLSESLGKYASVFQAEIYAILMCGWEINRLGLEKEVIHICSDSRAALLALKRPKVCSRLVDECKNLMAGIAGRNNLHLVWVPGHMGIHGNETADRLAKQGASKSPTGPEPVLGIPCSLGGAAIKELMNNQFIRDWNGAPGMRQSKCLIVGPNPGYTGSLLKLNRKDLKLVTEILTGHCHLNEHLTRIGVKDDSECRWCLEDEESSLHVITSCPAIVRARHKHLGSPMLSPEEAKGIEPRRLLAFLSCIGLP